MVYAGFVRPCNKPRAARAIYKDELPWRSSWGKLQKFQNTSIFPFMTGVGIMTMPALLRQSWDDGWVFHTESGVS